MQHCFFQCCQNYGKWLTSLSGGGIKYTINIIEGKLAKNVITVKWPYDNSHTTVIFLFSHCYDDIVITVY